MLTGDGYCWIVPFRETALAIYLISMSLHAPQTVPPVLRTVLIDLDAREVMRGTCLVETEMAVNDVMALIGTALGPQDALFVAEMPQNAHWAGGRVSRPAILWLKERRP